jgi:ubiquinone/menaquinone biosynthesis C-methylase UbiE
MLTIARENAALKGISNYETKSCDISDLPFPDNTFDAISCRFGFMFFPEMIAAAKEMNRVLKPGGRFATSVWGPPEKNFWVTSMMGPVMRNMQIPPPPAGAPGMFRCADSSQMISLFKQAGMKNVVHKEVNDKTEVESIDYFWTYMNDVAAPIVAAMSKADDAMKVKIKKEVFDGIRQKYSGDTQLKFDYQAIVFYGEK